MQDAGTRYGSGLQVEQIETITAVAVGGLVREAVECFLCCPGVAVGSVFVAAEDFGVLLVGSGRDLRITPPRRGLIVKVALVQRLAVVHGGHDQRGGQDEFPVHTDKPDEKQQRDHEMEYALGWLCPTMGNVADGPQFRTGLRQRASDLRLLRIFPV
jgi:hypothetical protein